MELKQIKYSCLRCRMKIKIVNASDNPLPSYAHEGDAGFDLMANETVILNSGEIRAIATGLYMEIPRGYEGQIRSRSGLSLKDIIVNNSPGTVDSNFQGEIKVILKNGGFGSFKVEKGMKIAQMVIARHEVAEFEVVNSTDDFSDSERGTGGFGSTGL